MKSRFSKLFITGIAALLLFDIALNVLLLQQDVFSKAFLIPSGIALVLCILWGIMGLARLAEGSDAGKHLYGMNAVIGSIVFFSICAALYALALRWDVSYDLTREGRRDLAPQTVQILQTLNREVKVYGLFTTTGDSAIAITKDKTMRFLERCLRHTDYLNIQFADPEQDPTLIRQLNLTRVSAQGTIVIECGARQRVIPLSGVTARLEERDFTNALINVVRQTEPVVYFLTGHGELNIQDGDNPAGALTLVHWLEKESYTPKPLTLTDQVPPDCDVLVILGPTHDLTTRDISALDEYMNRGGRLLVAMDMWAFRARFGVPIDGHLRTWLRDQFGIITGDNIVMSHDTGAEQLLYPVYPAGDLATRRGSYNESHPITRGLDKIMVTAITCSVEVADTLPSGATGEALIWSLPDTWAETSIELLQDPQASGRFRMDPDERQGPIPLAAAVTLPTRTPVGDTTQTRDARIVVLGSPLMASNEKIAVLGNVNFLMNMFAWLNETEDLIGIRATGEEDSPIFLSAGQRRLVIWMPTLGMLHLILFAGLAAHILMRRSRQ